MDRNSKGFRGSKRYKRVDINRKYQKVRNKNQEIEVLLESKGGRWKNHMEACSKKTAEPR